MKKENPWQHIVSDGVVIGDTIWINKDNVDEFEDILGKPVADVIRKQEDVPPCIWEVTAINGVSITVGIKDDK